MKNFDQKVAVITGAGSGLGRALALQLNQAGAHLALCDLNTAGLEETQTLAERTDRRISLHTIDVSDREAMQALCQAVLQHHGAVDLLINNAGITLTPTCFEDIPPALFEKVIQVNQWGVYNGVWAFLPHLKTRPEASIVILSSLAGLVGLYGYTPYAMSKFAIRGLAEALQMELAGSAVSVLIVHPGGIKTNIIKNAPDLSAERREAAHAAFSRYAFLEPEGAARQILRAVHKRQKRLIIGIDAKIVHTIRVLFPNRFPDILQAIFKRSLF